MLGVVWFVAVIAVDAKRAPVTVIPQCMPTGVQAPDPKDAAALAKASTTVAAGAAHRPETEQLIHIAFYDTRPRPDVVSMRRAAALCNSSARVRFHALLKYPMKLPDFHVTLLQLPKPAQCLYDGMRRISHGPGPQYLYKPLLHRVLPDVERLILLDTDVVMVRDVEAHTTTSYQPSSCDATYG